MQIDLCPIESARYSMDGDHWGNLLRLARLGGWKPEGTIAPSYMFHQDNPELTVSGVWPVEPERPVITHVDPDAMPDFGLIENALD